MPNLTFILSTLFSGYLLGSIPSGFIAGKVIAGVDLREIGSGSTGATNVLRHVGKWSALVVFIIDVSKGIVPVLIAKSFFKEDYLHVLSGVAALIGHIWPIWLSWKGGKAVATGLGVFLGLSWPVGLASLGIFLTIFTFSKIVSLSSLSAAISLPILMSLSFKDEEFSFAYFSISIIAMSMVIWRHRSNINRLSKGEEAQVGRSN